MEVQRAERAVAHRGSPPRVHLRRHLPPAHDREGPQPRHGVVLDARRRVGRAQGALRTLARAGEFRRRGSPAYVAVALLRIGSSRNHENTKFTKRYEEETYFSSSWTFVFFASSWLPIGQSAICNQSAICHQQSQSSLIEMFLNWTRLGGATQVPP